MSVHIIYLIKITIEYNLLSPTAIVCSADSDIQNHTLGQAMTRGEIL